MIFNWIMSSIVVIALFVIIGMVVIAFMVSTTIPLWKLFKKAGKSGWTAVIPVYNIVVLFQITGFSPLLILLFLVPFVNIIAIIIFMILQCIKLVKHIGKTTGVVITIMLVYINYIYIPIYVISAIIYSFIVAGSVYM